MANSIRPKAIALTLSTTTLRSSLLKPAKSPFSTAVKPLPKVRPGAFTSRPSIVARIPLPSYCAPSSAVVRHASSATTANQSSTSEDALTWDRFFEIRRKRRYVNLGSSFITAVAAVGTFGPVIAQQDIDGWAAQISGLDPIIVLGITTFAVAAGGWLCGPTFGNSLFKVWAGRKGWNHSIAEVSARKHAECKWS